MTGVYKSPFTLTTRLVTEIGNLLVAIDIDSLDRSQQLEIIVLKRVLADTRLDARDYELSETRAEQLEKAKAAQERLSELRQLILRASEFGIFSAIDIAELSARIEEIHILLQ